MFFVGAGRCRRVGAVEGASAEISSLQAVPAAAPGVGTKNSLKFGDKNSLKFGKKHRYPILIIGTKSRPLPARHPGSSSGRRLRPYQGRGHVTSRTTDRPTDRPTPSPLLRPTTTPYYYALLLRPTTTPYYYTLLHPTTTSYYYTLLLHPTTTPYYYTLLRPNAP